MPTTDATEDLQVLVADDSAVYRKLVADTLYYQPYSLLLAKSGREALDLFAQHSPPIVITDWVMPDLSGLELCGRIRNDSQSAYTYIILLTSMSEKDSLVKGLEAGADDFLSKPFDPAELQARLGVGRRIVHLNRQIEAKNQQLEAAVRVDPLTGLPNFCAVQDWVSLLLKGAALHSFPVWVVLADIDHFGELNETYGREAGDLILKEAIQAMMDKSRPSDIWGRVSDDEFISILTHVSQDDIKAVVERFRFELAAREFKFGEYGEHSVTVTASFGVVGFAGMEAPEFTHLVRVADRALFDAKEAGGNQIKIIS